MNNIPSEISLLPWVLANLAASTFMTGVIWFVQVVHYPLFERVGVAGFAEYEHHHARRTGWVVALPMIFELVAAVGLAYAAWDSSNAWLTIAGLGLVLVIWMSTFGLQVPCHNRLGSGFEQESCARLVRTNWIRTLAWSARSVLLLGLLLRVIHVL